MSQQKTENGSIVQQLQDRIRVLERENETLRKQDIGPLPETLSSGVLSLPVMAEMAGYLAKSIGAHDLRLFFLAMLNAQGVKACYMAGEYIAQSKPRLRNPVAIQMNSVEATARVLAAQGKLPNP